MNRNLCCNLHMTGNHCAKYEHPLSKKMKEKVRLQALLQILIKFDLDLRLYGRIGDLKLLL